jgi:hypothetical protein
MPYSELKTFLFYGVAQVRKTSINRLQGLLNGHLLSPQSKFQISNHHLPYMYLKLGFSYICALNQGAHTSFSKII